MRVLTSLVFGGALAALSACGGGGSGSKCETCNASVPPPVSRIAGQITDKSGVPVAGVTVSVYYHNVHTTQTTLTDANGNYVFTGLDANSNDKYTADYEVYAEKSGMGFYPKVSDPAAKSGDHGSIPRTKPSPNAVSTFMWPNPPGCLNPMRIGQRPMSLSSPSGAIFSVTIP